MKIRCRWESEGASGWSYAHCLPYFKKAQKHELGGDVYRGGDGPLHVSRGKSGNPLHEAFLAAGQEAGRPDICHLLFIIFHFLLFIILFVTNIRSGGGLPTDGGRERVPARGDGLERYDDPQGNALECGPGLPSPCLVQT